jgi:hypothetical protein
LLEKPCTPAARRTGTLPSPLQHSFHVEIACPLHVLARWRIRTLKLWWRGSGGAGVVTFLCSPATRGLYAPNVVSSCCITLCSINLVREFSDMRRGPFQTCFQLIALVSFSSSFRNYAFVRTE